MKPVMLADTVIAACSSIATGLTGADDVVATIMEGAFMADGPGSVNGCEADASSAGEVEA